VDKQHFCGHRIHQVSPSESLILGLPQPVWERLVTAFY